MSSITPEALAARVASEAGLAIVDVRTAREYRAGHVPGAVNVPLGEIGRRIDEIPGGPASEVIVYCGHGPRAWMAAAALRRHGFQRVTLLRGHWTAWRRAGLSSET
jgi:rhodanese-related sulfurtransferase